MQPAVRPTVRLCQLYPREMNIYADRGNLAVLAKRLAWRGLELEVTERGLGETFNPAEHDLYYLGGGQDHDQALVASDLLQTKAAALLEAFGNGAAGLLVCGGYQLAGYSYETKDHGRLPGLGFLDITTVAGADRLVGDVLLEVTLSPAEQQLLGAGTPASLEVLGYENHLGRTFLQPGAEALGQVVRGQGNNGEDSSEGARKGNVIGTYLHGPLLPRNPRLADLLLSWALEYRYGMEAAMLPLKGLPDEWEQAAHATAKQRAMTPKRQRGQSIR